MLLCILARERTALIYFSLCIRRSILCIHCSKFAFRCCSKSYSLLCICIHCCICVFATGDRCLASLPILISVKTGQCPLHTQWECRDAGRCIAIRPGISLARLSPEIGPALSRAILVQELKWRHRSTVTIVHSNIFN